MDVKSILKMADENRFAAAAIDVFDYQSAHWVVEAAERENMPVLLMFYPDMSWFIPFSTMAAIAVDLARQAKVPVGVHLDHGKSYEIAVGGIAAGFPSIMYDLSLIHIFTMGILAAKGNQLFNEEWQKRLNVSITDTGNALTDDEIMLLSKNINTAELISYRNAVGERTRKIVRELDSDCLLYTSSRQ